MSLNRKRKRKKDERSTHLWKECLTSIQDYSKEMLSKKLKRRSVKV